MPSNCCSGKLPGGDTHHGDTLDVKESKIRWTHIPSLILNDVKQQYDSV